MGGGGGMMKTIHRAAMTGTGGRGLSQDIFSSHFTSQTNITTNSPTYKPSSSDENSYTLSFSSNHHPPPFPSVNRPNFVNSMLPPTGEEYDDDFVFCTVPSMDEVNHAVSSLRQVLYPPTNCPEYDWIEPSTSMLQSRDFESVYDASHLLQAEPSVKRMVISLSTDKSVWNAVMNNEVVRELRYSVYEADDKSISGRSGAVESSYDPNPFSDVLCWIFINMKAKVMEVVENIREMVNKLFQSQRDDKKAKGEGTANEPFEKKLITTSFMFSSFNYGPPDCSCEPRQQVLIIYFRTLQR